MRACVCVRAARERVCVFSPLSLDVLGVGVGDGERERYSNDSKYFILNLSHEIIVK